MTLWTEWKREMAKPKYWLAVSFWAVLVLVLVCAAHFALGGE